MEYITSNIPFQEKGVNIPFPKRPEKLETPQKPVEKPPIENIMTLLEHIVKTRRRKIPLLQKMNLLTDKGMNTLEAIEEIEKVEEEIDFIDNYTNNLQNQAVVIMNEHNVQNIPLLEDIEKRLLLEEEREKEFERNQNA